MASPVSLWLLGNLILDSRRNVNCPYIESRASRFLFTCGARGIGKWEDEIKGAEILSVLGKILSVLLLFREAREEQPCVNKYLVNIGLDDVRLQEREGQ